MSSHLDQGGPVDSAETDPRRESPYRSEATPTYWLVVSRASDAVVVSLHGGLDGPASVRLGAILTDLIVGQGNLAVTVDLRDLGHLDAACVEVFAAAASAVELRGGALALSGPPDEIVGTLTSVGLARLISSGNAEHRPPLSASAVANSRAFHPAGGDALGPHDLEIVGRSRPAPDVWATPMSAGDRATLALGAPWRSAVVCSGCGQRPENLTPLDAVTAIRTLQRRCASLLNHPEDTLAHRRREEGSWSALEPAAQVSEVMGGADSRLRDLFGEDKAGPVPPAIEGAELAPAEQPGTPAAVLAALDGNVRGLVATITGATAKDWDCPRPHDGATVNEVVWLALHEATHHLEDAELLVDAASAAVQGRRRGP